jgi:thiol:disulfide interchange protein DsbD
VLSFAALGGLALALREAGLALGWGFQLQQPAVVGGLALLMFAVGLSLSGVFNLGGGLANVGGALTQKSGPAGDFFTGVLAVVVAAPCTAPFMGAALAYAFAASPVVAIGVFVALGIGLALPFLAIGFVPGLAQRLPKPGAWMDTLKQVLAFPMYLTAVWLVWVLAKQRGADAVGWVLGGAVLLALGLWAWEQARFKSPTMRAFAIVIATLGVAALWPVQQLPSAREAAAAAGTNASANAPSQPAADGSVPYSAEALAALRAEGRVVFVNMTADWCVSCKANERAVLSTDAFAAARNGANAVYMKGDWTDVDPAITAYLQQYGAVGVPFYAVYPAGGGEPEILPNLLTIGIVESALTKATAK